MASNNLQDELTCSICLSIYTDPVTLLRGRSFCWFCITDVLDTQDGSGVYTCPECRAEFQERPALEKNRKLRNIAESFLSAHPRQEEVRIFCIYCIQSPVPAAKTFLLCEASLCENHLRVHSKSEEHVLMEPTTSLGNRKCSVHKKVLEYYCCEDEVCICVSCNLAGEHRGHQMDTLNEASEKKKVKLRNILHKLTSASEAAEKGVQSLQELRRQEQEKATELSVMASNNLRDELTCSVCLSIYTDPVTLPCGHSFCWFCITDVLNTQEGSGSYKCPECRAEFQERPALEKNRKLRNIAESFLSAHPRQEEVRIFCTYCIQSPVPAAKTCLMCEASLCENHLRVHSKSEEHVLMEPTTSLGNRKCSVHKKVLEYYCCEDAACICVYCRLDGEHRGHKVKSLNEASENKKDKLRNNLEKLTSEREAAEKRVQSLLELKRQVQEKATWVAEKVTALIKDIREQLEALEKRVLSEISCQEKQVSHRVSDQIQQLEIEKKDLSRKMGQIQEQFSSMTDPLTILQGQEFDIAGHCDTKEGDNKDEGRGDVEDLDMGLISAILHSSVCNIVTGAMRRRDVLGASDVSLDVQTAPDISLDIKTAGNNLAVSDDLKMLSWSERCLRRRETSERFEYSQVLSSRSFSSGRHYWEVEVSESGSWSIGMVYPSIARKGNHSGIGYNERSWGLWKWNNIYIAMRDSVGDWLPHPHSCRRLGIYLDYEAGRLSFYNLCDPIRHLHTFTAAFTEPVHACFWACGGLMSSHKESQEISSHEKCYVRII